MNNIHNLKLINIYYDASECNDKTFEIRKNDRDFKIGDIIILNEYTNGKYTGRKHSKIITYILDDPMYLQNGYVCLGVKSLKVDML